MGETRFVTVARVEDVAPGTVSRVEAGDTEIALAHVDDRFYALQNACLHLGGPVGEGVLEGHFVTCPWHGWRYDVRTGLNDFDHAIELPTYAVRVDDGEVKVAL